MGCIHKKNSKSIYQIPAKQILEAAKQAENQNKQVSHHSHSQQSKIQIVLESASEKTQGQEKTTQYNAIDSSDSFRNASTNFKYKSFSHNYHGSKQISTENESTSGTEIEKEVNEVVLVYGKKYPLNSNDLRETQIFMTNPELEKMLQQKIGKEGKIRITEGDLSIIREVSEKSSSIRTSHTMERENQLVFVSIHKSNNSDGEIKFQRSKSIIKN